MNTKLERAFDTWSGWRGRVAASSAVVLLLAGVLGLAQVAGPRTSLPPAAPSASTERHQREVQGVSHITMPVGDLGCSVEFYTGVLGFERVSEVETAGSEYERLTGVFGVRVRRADLRLGDEHIELVEFLAPRGRVMPADSRSNDLWFQHIAIVTGDMDRAYQHLRTHNIRHISTGPQTLPQSLPNAAGISAFYFMDPDGHALEIIHFPPDKGERRWQKPSNKLFLGIDHTAIASSNTEASLGFYRDTLGMRVVGGSENFGTEQEHLNNVFGSRVRITTLKAPSGPGVELLEYLAPAGGRSAPTDSKVNDLWSWRTVMTASAPAILGATLDSTQRVWISPGVVTSGAHSAALMVRDPDGHLVEISDQP